MKIILNGAGFENKGAEAMARTVQLELEKRIPGIEIILWFIMEGSFPRAAATGMIPFSIPIHLGNSKWHLLGSNAGRLGWSMCELLRSSAFIKHLPDLFFDKQKLFCAAEEHYFQRNLPHFAAFIDISGYVYTDAWDLIGFQRIQPLINQCFKKGKPVIFLPQAWGPFEKSHVREALARIMSYKHTMFYSRDDSSSRYLENALKKPVGSIASYPDIAFRFSEANPQEGEHLIKSMGCAMNRPIIGISPNMRIFERVEGQGIENSYLQILTALIRHILEHHDADVILQANEIDETHHFRDDRHICRLITAAVNRPDRCFMTQDYLSAEASKSLIGKFDYLIGSRFHSFVFALSQGIPGMAIAWAHKYRELFSLFGMEENVYEFKDLNLQTLFDTFERSWNQRTQAKVRIFEKSKDLQIRIDALFDEVANKIRNEPQ